MVRTDIGISTNLDKITRHMRQLQAYAPKMMSEVMHDLTDHAAYIADSNCPVGLPAISGLKRGGTAGTLKQSLFVTKGEYYGRFGYTAKHAIWLEYGTLPHIIAPKNKPFLAWPIGATQLGKVGPKTGKRSRKSVAIRWVYTTKPVLHPGNRPVGWVRMAVSDAQMSVEQIAANVFERYAARLQIGGAKE